MNKKKLCATLTLSAFAASLLPGMAFADAANPAFVGNVLTYTATNTEVWLDDEDTVTVEFRPVNGDFAELKEGRDFAAEITAYVGADPGPEAAGKVAITLTSAVPEPGTYRVTLTDTNGEPATNATVGGQIIVDAAEVTDVTSNVTYKDGEFAGTLAEIGKVTFAGGGTDAVYKLDSAAGFIKKGSTAVGTLATNAIDASALTVDGYYGTATAVSVGAGDVAPNGVFHYTKAVAEQVESAVNALKGQLQSKLDLIPAEVVIDTIDGKVADLAAAIVGELSAEDTAAYNAIENGKLGVAGVDKNFGGDNKYATLGTVYTNSTDSFKVNTDAIDTLSATSVTGTITLVMAVDGVSKANGGYVTKDVKVTVTTATALADVVDAYGAENFTNYNKANNTGDIVFSKVGDGFDLTTELTGNDTTVKTGKYTVDTAGINYELTKYFDAKTGKVTALPTEDVTAKITLKLVDASQTEISGHDITVNMTIKAAGEFDPTEEFTKDELEALTDDQLAEVKEVADEAKADALAARNEKSEAAAKAYLDQNLDLTKPADLQKATELYLSYSAERKAYKEAKAYAALVDSVVNAGE